MKATKSMKKTLLIIAGTVVVLCGLSAYESFTISKLDDFQSPTRKIDAHYKVSSSFDPEKDVLIKDSLPVSGKYSTNAYGTVFSAVKSSYMEKHQALASNKVDWKSVKANSTFALALNYINGTDIRPAYEDFDPANNRPFYPSISRLVFSLMSNQRVKTQKYVIKDVDIDKKPATHLPSDYTKNISKKIQLYYASVEPGNHNVTIKYAANQKDAKKSIKSSANMSYVIAMIFWFIVAFLSILMGPVKNYLNQKYNLNTSKESSTSGNGIQTNDEKDSADDKDASHDDKK